MKAEVTVFLLTIVWGLVHLFLPAFFSFAQDGLLAAFGPRDNSGPLENTMGARASRANANFKETLPMALGLLLLVLTLGKTNGTSALGAWIYLGARVAYLPLYVLGIPYLRTLVWAGSLVGLFMVAMPLL